MDISRTILVVTVYDVFIIKTCLFCDQPDKYTHARTHKMVTVTVLKDAGTVQIVPCYHLTLRAWGLHSVECNDAGCPDGGPSKRFYVPRLMQLRSCTCRSLAQDVRTQDVLMEDLRNGFMYHVLCSYVPVRAGPLHKM